MARKYRVVIATSGKLDVKEKKQYILEHFKYREYAENYSQRIKTAAADQDGMDWQYIIQRWIQQNS